MSDATDHFADGAGYERHMGRWSRLVAEQFLGWLDMPKHLQWLDVGCGNGAFTEAILARCAPATVAAIDPSDGQLAIARARPETALVDFANADAQRLPYRDASFDVVAMALVIAFVPDPARAVGEMARVVRPGGVVAAYMWDLTAGASPISAVAVAMQSIGIEPPFPPQVQASRSDVLYRLWEDVGLESIETRPIEITVAFSDFEDYWESNSLPVGPLGQRIDAMPNAEKEELRLRLREQLPIAADGSIAFECRANAVRGRAPARSDSRTTQTGA